MTLGIIEVEHIALLARLALSDAEKVLYTSQLSAILEYAKKLQAIDTTQIAPITHMSIDDSQLHLLREDEPEPGLSTDDLLGGAPDVQGRWFRVPPIFD